MMRRLFLCASLFVLLPAVAVFGQQVKTIYSFSSSDGHAPQDKLVFDNVGNLYGTTEHGGQYNYGTIFELSPNADGTWSEVTLYSFCQDPNQYGVCLDGNSPTAGLVTDAEGNLYGVTPLGGPGYGVVFELSPPSQSGGAWDYQVIYDFCTTEQCQDGAMPGAKLTFDDSGNLYGTTEGNTVFELSPSASGWIETTLFTFCTNGYPHCADGNLPVAAVTFDAAGNLYGTTEIGGSSKGEGAGVVYKLTPGSTGWTETVLTTFSGGKRGGDLYGAINFDSAGNMYSTAFGGGTNDAGGVFRLSPSNNAETLVSFLGSDGNIGPTAGVLLDPKTNTLYGTTSGGENGGAGSLYKVSSKGIVTTIAVGGNPKGALIADKHGNLYGTYSTGGQYGYGAVFEIIP